MNNSKTALLALAAILTVAAPAVAHHSFAMFDMNKKVTLVGTVTKFRWINPHSWIELDVPDGDKTTHWTIEMTSPNNLVHDGWKRTSLATGDKVTIVIHPLRDGSPGGSLVNARLPNGTTLGQNGAK